MHRALAKPIDVPKCEPPCSQGLPGADHHTPHCRVEPHDIKRTAGGDAKPAPLADGVMDDALMAPEHAALEVDDIAGLGGAWPQPLDHLGVAACRHEADILAVVLVGHHQAIATCELARFRLGTFAKRKA